MTQEQIESLGLQPGDKVILKFATDTYDCIYHRPRYVNETELFAIDFLLNTTEYVVLTVLIENIKSLEKKND